MFDQVLARWDQFRIVGDGFLLAVLRANCWFLNHPNWTKTRGDIVVFHFHLACWAVIARTRLVVEFFAGFPP